MKTSCSFVPSALSKGSFLLIIIIIIIIIIINFYRAVSIKIFICTLHKKLIKYESFKYIFKSI